MSEKKKFLVSIECCDCDDINDVQQWNEYYEATCITMVYKHMMTVIDPDWLEYNDAPKRIRTRINRMDTLSDSDVKTLFDLVFSWKYQLVEDTHNDKYFVSVHEYEAPLWTILV